MSNIEAVKKGKEKLRKTKNEEGIN